MFGKNLIYVLDHMIEVIYCFQIKNLQEADTGFYICQILRNVTSQTSAEVELQIRRAPSILSDKTTVMKTQEEGGTLELHCSADGFPIPRISWMRDNNALLPDGGVVFW